MRQTIIVWASIALSVLTISRECNAQLFWEPISFATRVEPLGLDFFGDAIYAYGNGLHRLHRGATNWETLFDSSKKLNRLSISSSGKLLAYLDYNSIDPVYVSADNGLHWFSFSNPGFGSLEVKPLYRSSPYSVPLVMTSAAFTGDGTIYATGAMSGPYVNRPGDTTFVSSCKISKKCDTCGNWIEVGESNTFFWRCDRRDSAGKVLISGGSPPSDSMLRRIDWDARYSVSILSDSTWKYCNAIAPNGDMYKIDTNGVSRSSDLGATWTDLNSGLNTRRVSQIVIDPDGDALLYTDSGWFRSVFTFASVNDLSIPNLALHNFPNPFTHSTTIHFTLPSSEYVRIIVYDAQGREVSRVASAMYDAGEHEAVFNAETLPPGVYFYRLTAGGESQVRAMVLE